MLNTIDLEEYLKNIPEFYGVFAVDRLPFILLPKPASIIINLDPSYFTGSHWVCCTFNDKSAHYFDSFGREPPSEIVTFIERNQRKWSANKYIFQADNSIYCGYYCILFVVLQENFYNYFRPCKTSFNERLIRKLFDIKS